MDKKQVDIYSLSPIQGPCCFTRYMSRGILISNNC